MVRAGYKQTEVGVLPVDWDVQPLEYFTSFISYGFTNPMPTNTDGVLMVTAKDINYGEIQASTARYTSREAYDSLLTNKSKPKKNDVLLTKDGTLGRLALVGDQTICINQSVAILRPNQKVHPKYLKTLLEAPLYQQRMLDDAGGSTIKHIYITKVNLMDVGVPANLNEQALIANTLGDVDELISSLEKLIAKKRDIKTATMQQLLTGKKRLPGFGDGKGTKQTELGEIPEDWDVRTYGNTFSFLPTASNSRSDLSAEGDILYIHYGDIHTKLHFNLDLKKQQLPKIDLSKFRNPAFLADGDIVMVDASEDYEGIGKSIEVSNIGEKRVISGLHTFLLRDTEKHFADGFRAYLHSIPDVKRAFDTLATGMKVYGLSKNSLKDVSIPVPPFDEQVEIVKVISSMDAELQNLEIRLTKTKAIKQGMMQELLTGRTRLV